MKGREAEREELARLLHDRQASEILKGACGSRPLRDLALKGFSSETRLPPQAMPDGRESAGGITTNPAHSSLCIPSK
jgi:hypothetical protein